MKTFIISYLTKTGIPCLNVIIEASNRASAIDEIKEDLLIILSLVPIQ